jgi:hypothetical protein
MNDWPFDQPANCAVISLRQIVSGGQLVCMSATTGTIMVGNFSAGELGR